jgi:hypothetical protein
MGFMDGGERKVRGVGVMRRFCILELDSVT